MKVTFGGSKLPAGLYDDRLDALACKKPVMALSTTFKTLPVDSAKQVEFYRDAWRNEFPEIAAWWAEQDKAHADIMRQINEAFAAGYEEVTLMDDDEVVGTMHRDGRLRGTMCYSGAYSGRWRNPRAHLCQDPTAKAQLTEVDDGKNDYRRLGPFDRIPGILERARYLSMPWSLAALDEGNAAPSKPAQATTKIEIPVRRIACHAFGPDGTCDNLVADDGGPARRCGRRFGDIASATKDDLYKVGWSCNGTLAPHELAEIEAERERIWQALKGA